MTALYVDLSHHDWDRVKGELDWARIKAATSPAVCIRATYGDPGGWHRPSYHFAEMAAGARAAGFTVGAYHNLVKGDQASINRQVDWLRREMDIAGATWAMADIEPYPELVTADMWPRWDDVKQFHDRWYSLEDRVCAWYIAQWFWTIHSGPDLGQPDLRVLRGPLVQSHYAGGDGTAAQIYAAAGGDNGTGWDDRYGNRLPDIWQYTSSANVSGASGSTDVNAFKGTLAQLRALLIQEEDMLTPAQDSALSITWEVVDALRDGQDTTEERKTPVWLVAQVKAMRQQLDALAAQPAVAIDYDKLADALLRRVITTPQG